MPEKETLRRAARAKRAGKSPSTQAGEFVREEMHHVREGKHGARSTKQAIAIGLSMARRSGVKLGKPPKGSAAANKRTTKVTRRKPAARRSRVATKALKREGRSAASHTALSRQARQTARQRTATDRRRAAMKAVRTKGAAGRKRAAQKAAATRERRAA